jgi:hypothetical protein
MTDQPITPPSALINWWRIHAPVARDGGVTREAWIATQAARWGADQELEACCAWVEREIGHGREWNAELRAARRPKPPSLKEVALTVLDACSDRLDAAHENTIRRALEALSDD